MNDNNINRRTDANKKTGNGRSDVKRRPRRRRKTTGQKILSALAYVMMCAGVLGIVISSVPVLSSAFALLIRYGEVQADPDDSIFVDPSQTYDPGDIIIPSTEEPHDPQATAIPGSVDFTLPDFKNSGIYNIAVFGVDNRDPAKFSGLSDVIMILSVDTVKNKMYLTSFMRDLLVNIPGHGYSKINAAFAYGGPELAAQTIANNFGLEIDNYVVVNFAGAREIIDKLGGVDLELSDKEVEALRLEGYFLTPTSGNTYHLEGNAAVEYMRIRKIDSDKYRTQRQAKVMQALMDKYSSSSLAELLDLMNTLTSYVRTDMSLARMASVAMDMYKGINSGFNHATYPFVYKGFTYHQQACITEDTRTENIIELYQRLYNFTPSFS